MLPGRKCGGRSWRKPIKKLKKKEKLPILEIKKIKKKFEFNFIICQK